jgi:NAD+ kinase
MKLLLYGHNIDEIKHLAEKAGFEIVEKNPDVVASYGGDGTFMKAENKFPRVPKFALKKSKICKKCHDLPVEETLRKVFSGEYRTEEEIKIESIYKGKRIVGLNEIIVHNLDPRRAIRYEVFVNDEKIDSEIIGDGVVISTPYGSTGYYRSITDGMFEVGIGLAFNNSTEQSDHMVLKENSEIKIKIVRGPAMAYADNDEVEIPLEDGDIIEIKKSKDIARIIKII